SCSSVSPWLRLSRATSIPASTRALICSGDSVAAPMVHTIFALRMGLSLLPFGGGAWATSGRTVPNDLRVAARPWSQGRGRAGQMRSALGGLVDGAPGRTAPGDRPHAAGLAAAGVAGHEGPGDARRVRAVTGDGPAPREVDARLLDELVGLGTREAHRDEHEVRRDVALGARGRDASTVREVLGRRDAQRAHVTVLVPEQRDGRGEVGTLAAPLVRGGDREGHGVGRPGLVLGALGGGTLADGERRDRGGALAQRGAEAVRAGVAATDDDHVLAGRGDLVAHAPTRLDRVRLVQDRKSTRLNSSHVK